MAAETYVIDAETVHNWRQRYAGLEHYASAPAIFRAAVDAAWKRHHADGANAAEEADALKARFPKLVYTAPEWRQ